MQTRAARKRDGAPSPPSLFPDKAPQRSPQTATADHAALTQEQGQKKNTQKEPESNDDAVWVQCESKKCLKWRRIAKEAAGSLPDVWYCCMHPDPTLQSCDAPEEQWFLEENELFTYHGLIEGELVWAKLAKYPPWPAIVSRDPWCNNDFVCDEKDAGGLIYHVEFLGKSPTHSWLPEEMVEPYRDLCSLQLAASICPREVMASNKRLQTAIRTADSLLLESPSKRLQCLHYTTAMFETERSCGGVDKKKPPSGKSKIPRGVPKKQQQSIASDGLQDTTAAAAAAIATMVPLHTLPGHIQHSLLESETMLFQLLKPVDGQTSAVQVLTNKPPVTSKQKKPLAELNNNSQASSSQKLSKMIALPQATKVFQLKKPDSKNARPSLAQSLISRVKQTNSSLQGRKRTPAAATSRPVEPNKKKMKSKGAAQSTNIKQYFTQTATNPTPPPSQGRTIPCPRELAMAVEHPADDQVVPTMAANNLISNLEDEMRSGLDEMEILLYTMTQEDGCTSKPTNSWSGQEEEHCCSPSLAAQTDRALQDLVDIEELMKEIG